MFGRGRDSVEIFNMDAVDKAIKVENKKINFLMIFLPLIPLGIYKVLNYLHVFSESVSFVNGVLNILYSTGILIVGNYFIAKKFVNWQEKSVLSWLASIIAILYLSAGALFGGFYIVFGLGDNLQNVFFNSIIIFFSYFSLFFVPSSSSFIVIATLLFATMPLSAFITTVSFAFRRPRTFLRVVFGAMSSLYFVLAVAALVLLVVGTAG